MTESDQTHATPNESAPFEFPGGLFSSFQQARHVRVGVDGGETVDTGTCDPDEAVARIQAAVERAIANHTSKPANSVELQALVYGTFRDYTDMRVHSSLGETHMYVPMANGQIGRVTVDVLTADEVKTLNSKGSHNGY